MPIPVLSHRLVGRDDLSVGVTHVPQRQSKIPSCSSVISRAREARRLPSGAPSRSHAAPPSRLAVPITRTGATRSKPREQSAQPIDRASRGSKAPPPIVANPLHPPALRVGNAAHRPISKPLLQRTACSSTSLVPTLGPRPDCRYSRGGPSSIPVNRLGRALPHRIVPGSFSTRKEDSPTHGPQSSIGRLRRRDVSGCMTAANGQNNGISIGITHAARAAPRIVSMPSVRIPKPLCVSLEDDNPETPVARSVAPETITQWLLNVAQARSAMTQASPTISVATSPILVGAGTFTSLPEAGDDVNGKLMIELAQLLDTPLAPFSPPLAPSAVNECARAGKEPRLSQVNPLRLGNKRPCTSAGGLRRTLERSVTRLLIPTLHSDVWDARSALRVDEAGLDGLGFFEDDCDSESNF